MRLADWPERLRALIEANSARPHCYGEWDCMLLAGAVIAAMTGKDHTKTHRGKYKSQATAVRHLKNLGFDSPEAMLDSLLEEKPIGFAQRGDLVLVPGEGWNLPAVCMGDFALFIATDGETEGLKRVPRALWLKAWGL